MKVFCWNNEIMESLIDTIDDIAYCDIACIVGLPGVSLKNWLLMRILKCITLATFWWYCTLEMSQTIPQCNILEHMLITAISSIANYKALIAILYSFFLSTAIYFLKFHGKKYKQVSRDNLNIPVRRDRFFHVNTSWKTSRLTELPGQAGCFSPYEHLLNVYEFPNHVLSINYGYIWFLYFLTIFLLQRKNTRILLKNNFYCILLIRRK